MKKVFSILFCLLALCLGGCRSTARDRMFLIPENSSLTKLEQTPAYPVSITSVTIPAYLNRREMVRLSEDGELEIIPHRLWAQPLEHSVADAFADNISRLLGGARHSQSISLTLAFKHLELRGHDFVAELLCNYSSLNGTPAEVLFTWSTPVDDHIPLNLYYQQALGELSRQVVLRMMQP